MLLHSGRRTLPLPGGLVLSCQGKKCPSALHTPHDVSPRNKPKSCGTDNLLNVRRNNLLFLSFESISDICHNSRKLTRLRNESCRFSSLLMLSVLLCLFKFWVFILNCITAIEMSHDAHRRSVSEDQNRLRQDFYRWGKSSNK